MEEVAQLGHFLRAGGALHDSLYSFTNSDFTMTSPISGYQISFEKKHSPSCLAGRHVPGTHITEVFKGQQVCPKPELVCPRKIQGSLPWQAKPMAAPL